MNGCPAPSPDESAALAARMGPPVFELRRRREEELWRRKSQGRGDPLRLVGGKVAVFRLFLIATGLWRRAHAEFFELQVVQNPVRIPGLPAALEGFRLLHLSDIHGDLAPALTDRICECLAGLDHDAAVFTGDHVDRIRSGAASALAQMKRIAAYLNGPCYSVPGNHDLLAAVPALEQMGFRFLLNESIVLPRGPLAICGVDDPRFFRTHDLRKARAGVPGPAILLAHSPEVWAEADQLGFSLMLSGHTHGGQVCLPGGRAVFRNAPVPADLLAGAWKRGNLTGYTSRGAGGSGLAARLSCPPEITVHILHG
ncbi:MAG: metallophosphoesterase [Terrimicrobiaceae bacterium]|nr:metallophosphoesterase [Terrimicrobiaceae bacterium]